MIGFFEWLRRAAFWSLDALKGGQVRKHYLEIQSILDEPESEENQKIRQKILQDLLEHTIETVPFYKDIDKSSFCLEDFPIVEKQMVRENFDQFQSELLVNENNYTVTTSGSTGKPFKLLQNKDKKARNSADTFFFAEQAGYRLGSRLFYLRLWDKQYQKNRLLTLVQNMATYSVDDLTENNLARLVKELQSKGPGKSILAYTSALETICTYVEHDHQTPLDCKIDSIIAVAEALSPNTQERVKNCFGTEVISRYSNSENGILAQQRTKNFTENFQVNWASYHIEILDLNKDRPVKEGQTGRIVITDLFNYAMPLIRYDTGDVGAMEYDAKNKAMALTKIEGRKMDMFTNTKGEYISSHIIHHILQFGGIDQFQFVQETNGEYIIKMKVSLQYDYADEARIRQRYATYFGEDAMIRIEYVEDIPLLPSGKRKLVINKWQQTPANILSEESFD
ncbi:phenylacetate--CoA ligase family protein [Flagellimonas taeanensis]|uniref:phenylacetate--CoA ligase family protein n=1 Tax=Flavobacteriaceae TaxID=49546 RepID=UPI000E697D8B|nr:MULTISPECIES: phenylacetate--CoA ligase family protein [Allomuricauda]MDC6385743.1 phenylacetate--CoA ligase family protein [Muricauda sp. SK9]RIV50969.1 phenylacetate--CoA ligase family protein [Allomuricauda taeanensis]